VTEAGPADGRPVVALHGWPQHHFAYRHLLADPPEGLRIISPDLPGYGWSGPAPHRWKKEDVATDVLALIDALGIEKALLVGHDWGGYVGYLMTLREEERFDGYLALNIAHPWQTFRTSAAHSWRFLMYQPLIATLGVPLHRRTRFVEYITRAAISDRSRISLDAIRCFSERFRDPVCAETARDTYRTFLTREVPEIMRHPETRRLSIPVRGLHGVDDQAIHYSLASKETALADDYKIERVEGCGHFIADERPDLVREHLIALAAETT
ncbi:MAG TPA: alpha/beta hydrolase, partial [Solirubrobacterales bacterium]|nr:alpha/beta hydrolase [Solirubrobacterales bacterium]